MLTTAKVKKMSKVNLLWNFHDIVTTDRWFTKSKYIYELWLIYKELERRAKNEKIIDHWVSVAKWLHEFNIHSKRP